MSDQRINDGGPAFPCPTGTDGGNLFDGMALRDYFAGQAMQTLLLRINPSMLLEPPSAAQVGLAAYEVADAMLKAREARP